MSDDTIREDVAEEQDEQERQLSARELAMQEISDKLDSARDLVEEDDEDDQTEQAATIPAPSENVERVSVKVNGQEREISLEELKASYQKDQAAAERLRQASEMQKALQERERELLEREAALNRHSDAPEASKERIRELRRLAKNALLEGDVDASEEYDNELDELLNHRAVSTRTPDTGAIVAQITAQMEAQNALKEFFEQNPDLQDITDENGSITRTKQREYGDYVFDAKYKPLMDAGQISYREALNRTVQEVRAIFPQAAGIRGDIQERKRNLDTLPVATGARRVSATEDEDDSPAAVINQMRKARGLRI